ncbi:MAG: hypothetical protein IPO09_11550 [Anaeromyxobacter sp.]|nr:hypothetical protein [Anaeromyxobacter sp.]MBL0276890.1 hypothetical protein [Anaeromyxobacter sp.]
MVDRPAVRLDHPTLEHAILQLEARLQAVVTYGAGGCPTCHDAELRGGIAILRRLLEPAAVAATSAVASRLRRR